MPGWLKRFILWDYARASWQYDVMVGVILVFIFLTPRSWFRDQPRMPQASQVTLLAGGHGNDVLWIDPELLAGVPEDQRVAKLAELLRSRPEILSLIFRSDSVLPGTLLGSSVDQRLDLRSFAGQFHDLVERR